MLRDFVSFTSALQEFDQSHEDEGGQGEHRGHRDDRGVELIAQVRKELPWQERLLINPI